MTDPGLLAVRWSRVDAELSVCPRSPIKPNLNATGRPSALRHTHGMHSNVMSMSGTCLVSAEQRLSADLFRRPYSSHKTVRVGED